MTLFGLIKSDYQRLLLTSGRTHLRIISSKMFIATILIRLNTSTKFSLKLFGKLLLQCFFMIEVASSAKLGPGLLLPHPKNIILGCFEIGKDCTIMHGVTLGARKLDFTFDSGLRPTIGNSCFLGINSVILGGGCLEDNATVSPNSVIILKRQI